MTFKGLREESDICLMVKTKIMFQILYSFSCALGSLKCRCDSSSSNFDHIGQEHSYSEELLLVNNHVEKNLISLVINEIKNYYLLPTELVTPPKK